MTLHIEINQQNIRSETFLQHPIRPKFPEWRPLWLSFARSLYLFEERTIHPIPGGSKPLLMLQWATRFATIAPLMVQDQMNMELHHHGPLQTRNCY